MTFSIIIGLVQILFGKTIAALKIMSQKGKKYGIAPLAWVFIILALCLVFGLPMLNVQLPEMVKECIPGNSRAWIAGRFPLQYAGQEYLPELRYRSVEYLQYGFRTAG